MFRAMTAHPAAVGETYWQHLRFASAFGRDMVIGGLACFVHGLLPFLFMTKGSRTVLELTARMQRSAGRRQVQGNRTPGRIEPEYVI